MCPASSLSDTTVFVPNGVCSFLTAARLIGVVSRALRGVEVGAVVEEELLLRRAEPERSSQARRVADTAPAQPRVHGVPQGGCARETVWSGRVRLHCGGWGRGSGFRGIDVSHQVHCGVVLDCHVGGWNWQRAGLLL